MDRPLTPEEINRIRRRCNSASAYLAHVKRAMAIRGHDNHHTFFKMIADTHERLNQISTACLYVAHEGGFSVEGGSLAEGPIPPRSKD